MSNTQKTILLIENSVTEKENFMQLAQKEGLFTVALESSYAAIQWLKKNNEADMIVVSENAAPLNAYQTFDYIRQELKKSMPVIISKPMENLLQDDSYAFIDKPYTTSAVKALKLMIEPNVSSAAGLKVYSLEYLETISGGNHEFLIDCLKTFISSVSGKMDELKAAVSNNDIKSIGAIAHNIKPSFEMLENEKARDICNMLTYEAENSDISQLATELNKEFKIMEKSLHEDFSELR